MNNQTTPVHIRLWHHEFWLLVIADLLLTMSVYMLIPTFPQWLMGEQQLTAQEAGMSMAAFALGLYVFGPSCSWLVQNYRRNMVCLWAIAALAVNVIALGYFSTLTSFPKALIHRVALGAAFGLAQMVLTSTLIIDTCESHQRTEANFGAAWFSRFALSLGPLTGLALAHLPLNSYLKPLGCPFSQMTPILFCSGILALVSLVLIYRVKFPFRTPEEGVSMASLDRFFLPSGCMLFVNLLLISMVVGMVLTQAFSLVFFALMMSGFLLALLAQRFVFRNAELESEVLSGLILLIAALLVLMIYPQSPVAPLLMGLAVGIVSSRFLLFFVKLSRHCQRGTSQSTYFLGWESGLALGLGLGYGLFYDHRNLLFCTCLTITVMALVMYHFLTHQWFMKHKNR
jgi:MFS family permease